MIRFNSPQACEKNPTDKSQNIISIFVYVGKTYYLVMCYLKGILMAPETINISEEQLTKLIDAYKTIQEFLETAIPPKSLYRDEFLAGLSEADKDIHNKHMNKVHSLDDFIA
jgi:hypothetical protein